MKSSKVFFFSIISILIFFLIIEILLRTLNIGSTKKIENFDLTSKFINQPSEKQSFSLQKTFRALNLIEAPPGMTITVSNFGDKYVIKIPFITTQNDFQSFQKEYLTQVDEQLYVFKKNVRFPNYKLKLYRGMRINFKDSVIDKGKITAFYEIPKYYSWEELNSYIKAGVFIDSETQLRIGLLGENESVIKSPDVGYKLKPFINYQAKSGGDFSRLNSEGFRDDEFNSAAKYKILVLGDSCSFGIGIESTHEIYSSLLEKKLNNHLKSSNLNAAVEVYNTGTPSYSVFQGLMTYEALKNKTQWDFVVVMFGWNAPTQIFKLKNLGLDSINYEKVSRVKEFFRQLKSYSVLKAIIQNISGIEKLQNNWEKIALEKLVESALKNKTNVVLLPLVYAPGNFTKEYIKRIKRINKTRKDVANNYNVNYVESLSKIKLAKGNPKNWVDNIHFGTRGHEIVSDHLFNFFQTELNLN